MSASVPSRSAPRSTCVIEALERRALLAATISGAVMQDVTGNGLSADDTPLAGVTVKLYKDLNANGKLDGSDGAAIATKTSAAGTGAFAFSGLAIGKYIVQDVAGVNQVRTWPYLTNTIGVDVTKKNGTYGNNLFANYVKNFDKTALSNISYTINSTTTVNSLTGNVEEGDHVTVTFTVAAGKTVHLSLASYKADAPYSSADNLQLQQIYQVATGTFGAGTHSLSVFVPNSYFQLDFVFGAAIDQFGPAGSHVLYGSQSRLISFVNGGVTPPVYDQIGDEGNTPGFWKNNTNLWVGYSPSQTLESVFDVPNNLGLDNVTLLGALNFSGGSGVKGAAKNLFRQAVAAILNARHPLVDYALTSSSIITQVNAALASNNAAVIETLKNQLDEYNNAGAGIDAYGNAI